MSEGPIKAALKGRRVDAVSTPDNVRVCMWNSDTQRAYCGRKHNNGLVHDWALAVCSDCRAASRADETPQSTLESGGSHP